MPLLDHFRPPLSRQRHWDAFHSQWCGRIAEGLNEVLPAGYFAEPQVHRGVVSEIDVATFEASPGGGKANGAGGTAVWSPARPTLSIPILPLDADAFEVKVFREEGGPKLVASIELVSPGNKDRPESRARFLRKMTVAIQEGVSLLVIDVVTTRTAALHAALLSELQGVESIPDSELFAASYRPRITGDESFLDVWHEALQLGEGLPTLPLWLNPTDAVPVELEESYAAACRTLRISET